MYFDTGRYFITSLYYFCGHYFVTDKVFCFKITISEIYRPENNPFVEKKQKTMKLPIILSLSLSIAIIIIILYFTIDADEINTLFSTRIKYEFFVVAVLLNICYWVLWAVRMRILANTMEKRLKLSIWGSTKIVIANMFLASITPSMAGGEPVRIYLLNKEGMAFGCATAAVLGERLLDAVFVLLMVPFAVFVVQGLPGIQQIPFISTVLLIGVIVFILFLALFIYAILKPEKTKKFLIYINKKLSRFSKKKESSNKAINRISREVDNFSKSMFSFAGERKALVLSSIVTVIFWSSGFLIPSFVLMGLGFPPFFVESFAAQVLLLVIIMMPTTPGSAGVAEISILGLYGVIIGSTTHPLLGVFVLLYRFITYHMNLIVGAIFMQRIFKSVASFSMDMVKKKEGQQ